MTVLPWLSRFLWKKAAISAVEVWKIGEIFFSDVPANSPAASQCLSLFLNGGLTSHSSSQPLVLLSLGEKQTAAADLTDKAVQDLGLPERVAMGL